MTTTTPTRRDPRAAQQHPCTVRVDGDRQVAYAEYGPPDGGPVVFLHGTPGSRRLGALLEPQARERGLRVLTPERPGYGRSSPWPGRSVRDAADFLTPVLDDAGVQSAGLVAFSGGAPYALATAARRPERVDRVDVVSGATPPDISGETPAVQRLLAGLATTAPPLLCGLLRGQAWVADRLDPSFVVAQYTAGDNDGTVPDAAAEIVKEDFVEAFANHRSGAVTEFREAATDWGIDLGGIDPDVRLWHGKDDTNVPIDGVRRLAREMPGAELHAIDGADHLQTLLRSRPDVLAGHR